MLLEVRITCSTGTARAAVVKEELEGLIIMVRNGAQASEPFIIDASTEKCTASLIFSKLSDMPNDVYDRVIYALGLK